MSSKIQIIEAESEATKVIKQLNLTSLPICPFYIAQVNDISVEPKETNETGVSGFLLRVGNCFGIQYATHIKNEGFIRFTVAHELGHYFLPGHIENIFYGKNGYHKSNSGFISNDPYEKQADYFAKELLMPKELFSFEMKEAGEGFEAIISLSSKCKTSITATAIRYAQLSKDPLAVVMTNGNFINWCFLSEPLTRIINIKHYQKETLVPLSTATSIFNKDNNNIIDCKKDKSYTYLDHWFDEAPHIEMKEDIVGLGGYNRTLTVLFTNEIIDNEEDDDYLEIGNEEKGWKWK